MLQVIGTFVSGPLPKWAIAVYQLVTLMSYMNSAINPVLYAFLTDNFRRTLAESVQRSSRSSTSSVFARGLAVCINALYVSAQQPILLSLPSSDKAASAIAEPRIDDNERSGNCGDDDIVQATRRALSTSSWIVHEEQSPSTCIELHVIYDDSRNDNLS